MAQEPPSQQPTRKELQLGARIFSLVAAGASVGFVIAHPPLKYLLAGIALICFVRSVICFRKAARTPPAPVETKPGEIRKL